MHARTFERETSFNFEIEPPPSTHTHTDAPPTPQKNTTSTNHANAILTTPAEIHLHGGELGTGQAAPEGGRPGAVIPQDVHLVLLKDRQDGEGGPGWRDAPQALGRSGPKRGRQGRGGGSVASVHVVRKGDWGREGRNV